MATAITAVPTSLASSAAKLSERPGNVVGEDGKRWLVLIGADSDSDEILEFFREMMPDVEHDKDLIRRARRLN